MTANAQITAKRVLTAALSQLWVRPDRDFAGFRAGRFVSIGIPDPVTGEVAAKRAYSLASAEGERDLELYVRLVREGALTPKLLALEPGARIWIDERYHGTFTLDAASGVGAKQLVFVATGTGLAPFVSMLRTEVGRARFERIVVVHGVRLPEELTYSQEIAAAAREGRVPRIEYLPACSRPPADSGWKGLVGRLPELFASGAIAERIGPLDPRQHHVFLCGNPDMIVALEAWLVSRGHKRHRKREPGNVHVERYW